jgi:hypothetical protein
MKKVFVVLILVLVTVLVIVSCGKKDKNRDDYDKIDHVLSNPSPTEAPRPTNSPTPTEYVPTTEDIMNSYSKENVHEATVDINVARVYDKPYQGKIIGFLINEHFNTENLYRSNHNNMYGFHLTDTSGHFYEVVGEGVYEIKQGDFSKIDVVWVYDSDCMISLVFHPEDYDFSDWGVEE